MSASLPRAELTDSHRLFLQAMMWRRICDSGEIIKICTQSLESCNVPVPQGSKMNHEIFDFVTKINAAIKPMNLSIVKCIDEITGTRYYSLISSVDNHISRLSTEYTQTELELFRKIIELIVHSSDGHTSSTNALNLTDIMEKKINKVDAQEIIKKFLRDKWLCQTKAGYLYLSPRCIAELDYFLTTSYGDVVVKCNLCQNTVIQAARCASCKVKVHRHCIQRFLNEQNCCPSCHKEWEEYSSSAEEGEEEEEEEEEDEERVSRTKRGRKRAHE